MDDFRRVRMGMVGGGEGAFIGPVHRAAAELDGAVELVCGAFSSDPERSRRSGRTLYRLPPERCYDSWQALLATEAKLPAAERMQFLTVATPNHLHAEIARAAMAAGFHVLCDKPLATDLAEAESLQAEAGRRAALGHPVLVGVTYNYTGYPMVREARELIASGALGSIRRVQCEYLQGWLAHPLPGNKQADWRTDPGRAGAAGCFGDIGSHCENLVSFTTGLEIESLCADLSTFVPGRRLDDDGSVLLRFRGGARGTIQASQVALGEENSLSLRVYGDCGALAWSQQEPNSLLVRYADRPYEVRRTGGAGLGGAGVQAARLPAGHPEGFLEAFANVYRGFGRAVAACEAGAAEAAAAAVDYPTLADGVRGMRFIDAVVRSSTAGGRWVSLP
ncbi:MAG: Gfo/Idh/MocA family oxidoreductase [Pseudomonadales bacterium]